MNDLIFLEKKQMKLSNVFFSRNEHDQKISLSNPTNCCLFIYVKVKHNFKELGKLITCFFKENLKFL
jgi:hypothetical protein